MDHSVNVRTDSPTILTAPNGAGKTHILLLVRAALGMDLKALSTLIFKELEISFSDGRGLHVSRRFDEEDSIVLSLLALDQGLPEGDIAEFPAAELEEMRDGLPHYIRRLGNGSWLDTRTDRVLSKDMMERRFAKELQHSPKEKLRDFPEILELYYEDQPILIDTKRLDAVFSETPNSWRGDPYAERSVNAGAARILEYTNKLRKDVIEARRNSIQATQSADLSFAARAISAAHMTVVESELHERYDEIVERYENLAKNSLAIGEAPIAFPQETTAAVRTILNVFLDDWERRLEPLLPLNEKIMTLREILDIKLKQSGKKTAMSAQGSLIFKTFSEHRIQVSSLSSGEQHLVALFTLLLFSAKRGSLVLIDEPEISLHAAWKHAFLADISRVAKIADLQVILSTHSTSIINGRWDLTEELNFPIQNSVAPPTLAEAEDASELDDILE
ncbi:AAA family ATPase [Arthrobacter sp. BPSS-3]|uniref:AAA family ATPase n=1 Tax=Arthrobacter sp. BPSS-3 TaxID=3366580 RepID=UPI0037DD76C7